MTATSSRSHAIVSKQPSRRSAIPFAGSRLRRRRPGTQRDRRAAAPARGLLLACLAVFSATVAGGLAWPHLRLPGDTAEAARPVQVTYVIDGDTFVLAGGERVRILNIDTAELPPRSQCDRETALALAAKARLAELLHGGEVVVLRSGGRDRDRYGRQLRRVVVDGEDVGERLVREGLAQRWRGRRGDWC